MDGTLLILLMVRKTTRLEVQSLATAIDQIFPLVQTIDHFAKEHRVGVFANYIFEISPL